MRSFIGVVALASVAMAESVLTEGLNIEDREVRHYEYYSKWDEIVQETHTIGCDETNCEATRAWVICPAAVAETDAEGMACKVEKETWWINTENVPDVNYDVVYEQCSDMSHCETNEGLRVERCNANGHECKPTYIFEDYTGAETEIIETMDCRDGVCVFNSSYKNKKDNWMHDKIKTCRIVPGQPAANIPRFSYGPLL